MRGEKERENHTQQLKVSCLSATVEKCKVGIINWQNAVRISGRKPLNPWGIWESILVMKCHMTQHASRSSACGGGKKQPFLYNRKSVTAKLLKQMPPQTHATFLRLSKTEKLQSFHLVLSVQSCCDFRADAWARPIPSTPLPVLLRVTQVLCIIHQYQSGMTTCILNHASLCLHQALWRGQAITVPTAMLQMLRRLQ